MIAFTYVEPTDPLWQRGLVDLVERLSGRERLYRLYRDYDRSQDFFSAAVERLKLDIQLSGRGLDGIPTKGPLVVVANHPFGVIDGIALAHLIAQRRQDLKIVAHGLLTRAPEAAERILPIDFSTSKQALATNLETRQSCEQWLEGGGSILIFPAGAVSSAPAFGHAIEDERWKPFTARLIQRARADVLPLFTYGRNSLLFQGASLVHPAARAALLLNEVRNKIGRRIRIHVGATIPYASMSAWRDRQQLVDALRAHVYALGSNDQEGERESSLEAFEPAPIAG